MAESTESIYVETEDQLEQVIPIEEETALDIAPEEIDAQVEEADEDLESDDSLTFSNGVIEKIVALAMRDVPGVVGMKGGLLNRIQDAFGATDIRKGVSVEVTPESAVKVNVAVFIEYGSFAPQVFEAVKKAVVGAVTGMTGLAVAGVNLRIEDVLTPEEIAERMPKPAPATPQLEEADEEEEISLEELEAEALAAAEADEVEELEEIEEAAELEEIEE